MLADIGTEEIKKVYLMGWQIMLELMMELTLN